ncbi:MAG TPA: hypothetical protein VKC61_06155 [Pyrinomonadaceae bacterium]|nr:hypothetical protein [Pyrinomonadaceae bacterium]
MNAQGNFSDLLNSVSPSWSSNSEEFGTEKLVPTVKLLEPILLTLKNSDYCSAVRSRHEAITIFWLPMGDALYEQFLDTGNLVWAGRK